MAERDPVLVVRDPMARQIVRGEKTMEIRGQNHRKYVGRTVYIQASQRPEIIGSVHFLECVMLDDDAFRRRRREHLSQEDRPARYRSTYGYVFTDAREFERGVPIEVSRGSITWRAFRAPSPPQSDAEMVIASSSVR